MSAPLRSALSAMLLAVYGVPALLGQGLHALACDDHHAGAVCRHEASAAESKLPGVQEAGDHERHDLEHCPVCQFQAQGQLAVALVQPCCWSSPSFRSACEARLPLPRKVHQPYGARAPPLSSAISV